LGRDRLIAGEDRRHSFFMLRGHYFFHFVLRFGLFHVSFMAQSHRRQTACAGVAGAGKRFVRIRLRLTGLGSFNSHGSFDVSSNLDRRNGLDGSCSFWGVNVSLSKVTRLIGRVDVRG
jgi:hypothetical protein